MKQTLYELYHFKIRASQEYDEDDVNRKIIGVYTTEDDAKAAIDRVIYKEGFRDWPEGFRIIEQLLDHDSWTEGFYDPSADETWPKTDAEVIAEIGGPFEPVTCSAELLFSGHRCDPVALNEVIGYGLAKGWRKGDRVVRDNAFIGLREKTGFCTFDSLIFCQTSNIDEHVVSLFWKCEQNLEKLQSIIVRDDLSVSIVCYFEDSAEANIWRPTSENVALSTRLGIPIRIAEVGRFTAVDIPVQPSVPEVERTKSVASSPEFTSTDSIDQPSYYLGT